MKKISICLIVIFSLLFSFSYGEYDNANLIVNSQNAGPVLLLKKGVTYCPVKIVGQQLGYNVSYIPTKKLVKIFNGSNNIQITINSKTVIVGNKKIEIDTPAFIHNSTTYVPLKFISDVFNASVTWNKIDKTAVVMSQAPSKTFMKNSYVYTSSLGYNINLPYNQRNNLTIVESLNSSKFYVRTLFNNPLKKIPDEGLMFSVVKSPVPVENGLVVGAYDEGYYYLVAPSSVMTPVDNVNLTQIYATTAAGINPYVQTIRILPPKVEEKDLENKTEKNPNDKKEQKTDEKKVEKKSNTVKNSNFIRPRYSNK